MTKNMLWHVKKKNKKTQKHSEVEYDLKNRSERQNKLEPNNQNAIVTLLTDCRVKVSQIINFLFSTSCDCSLNISKVLTGSIPEK